MKKKLDLIAKNQPLTERRSSENRLYYLDVLRGIASITVACFFHYEHLSEKFQSNSIGHIPPLYSFPLFKLFFDKGDLMVDVFFVLSGIVFTYTYWETIQSRKISAFDFFIRRFSRLYPIHLLTLLVTTCIIYLFFQSFKSYPIYQNNDIFHFILNLLFLQHGFFDKGYSFNGPAWSLSIEALMYILFFIQAKYIKLIPSSILLVFLGIVFFLSPHHSNFLVNIDVGRGLIGFFSGCLLYEMILKRPSDIYLTIILPVAGLLYIIYAIWFSERIKVAHNFQLVGILIVIIPYLHHSEFIRRHSKIRWLVILGDISLSVYLIHAPIQMLILFYFRLTGATIHYDNPLLFLFYCSCVISAGYLLHYYFEKPAQKQIRKLLDA
ncbi:acyltransferase family protein [Spirosoma harenae]